jgi:hypothetical protein
VLGDPVAAAVNARCKVSTNYPHTGQDSYFIIENEGLQTVPRVSGMDSASRQVPADMAALLQDQLDTNDDLHRRRRDCEASRMRDFWRDQIARSGICRPLVS